MQLEALVELIAVLSFMLISGKTGHPLSVLAATGIVSKPVRKGNKQSSYSKLMKVLVSWAVCIVLQ